MRTLWNRYLLLGLSILETLFSRHCLCVLLLADVWVGRWIRWRITLLPVINWLAQISWPQTITCNRMKTTRLGKRQFKIDNGIETISVEGHTHKNVAVRYLMKRRRSILGTRDPIKIDVLYSKLPTNIRIIGKQLTHEYKVNWERIGSSEYQGSRFVFTMDDRQILKALGPNST